MKRGNNAKQKKKGYRVMNIKSVISKAAKAAHAAAEVVYAETLQKQLASLGLGDVVGGKSVTAKRGPGRPPKSGGSAVKRGVAPKASSGTGTRRPRLTGDELEALGAKVIAFLEGHENSSKGEILKAVNLADDMIRGQRVLGYLKEQKRIKMSGERRNATYKVLHRPGRRPNSVQQTEAAPPASQAVPAAAQTEAQPAPVAQTGT